MLKTAARAVRVATRNWITSTSGTVLGACTTGKALGITYVVPIHGHPVDAVLAGMAISGAVLGWASKDGNKHSTAAEVQHATLMDPDTKPAQPPGVGR